MTNNNSIQELEKKIKIAQSEIKQSLAGIITIEELEKLRTAWLGRHGKIAELTQLFKAMAPEARKIIGPLFQAFKQESADTFEHIKKKIETDAIQQTLDREAAFDVTAYKPNSSFGSLHPLTYVSQRIEDIFISMGYSIIQGSEVETEYYNFEALNIPENHPARDMWDTLWLDHSNLLLRTHTSNVQIHYMEQQQPPFAIAATGRVYRHEATDATHDFMFNQVEGLVIGEGIAMTHLLGTVKTFFQTLFSNTALSIRVRPGYFPFVEPGIEIDITCPFCQSGCAICKHSRWIEMCGAGLVHPNVLKCTGINSKKYSGFAFGVGVSRIAMLLYGIPDVRLLASGKLDFLRQF